MNQKTFISIFLPLKNNWYQYAMILLNDPLDAQDVVQETYFKLWKLKHKLKNIDKKEAYAFMIVRNLCMDKLKKAKFTVDINQKIISHAFAQEDNDKLEYEDLKELLSKIVSQLPESQRLILQLRNINNYSIKQIAEELDMKPNTVEVNLSRARKTIRKKLNFK